MFTGIIESVGKTKTITTIKNGIRLTIQTPLANSVKLGESIAVNGACLTVTDNTKDTFSVDVSFETLKRTNLGALKPNCWVNLERALKLTDRLDGHIVLGHVDTTATIKSIIKTGDFYILSINIDDYTYRHSVEKGSIAIDGISLTISKLEKYYLETAIIPFTYEHTNLKYASAGKIVNIETDIIGKYIEKLIKKRNGITEEFLKQHGYT